MKKIVVAAVVTALSLGAFADQARAFNPAKALRKVVEAPGKVAGTIVERSARGAAKGVEGAVKGFIGSGRSTIGHPAYVPVWYVYYYPQGPHCPAQYVGAYTDYGAAYNCACSLWRQNYQACIVRVR